MYWSKIHNTGWGIELTCSTAPVGPKKKPYYTESDFYCDKYLNTGEFSNEIGYKSWLTLDNEVLTDEI